MAKGSKLGGFTNAGASPGDHGDRRRCIGCKRRIVWGERCESCKRGWPPADAVGTDEP